MPGFNRPAADWLTDHLRQQGRDISGLKKQSTEYIVNEKQECVAIIGQLGSAPTSDGGSEATGLAGWGIALKVGANWVSLAAALHTLGFG